MATVLQPDVSEPFSFEEFLAQQRAEYRASLPERLDRLRAAWDRLLAADDTASALHAMERCAHGLAGSAATFGLPALGDAARALEATLAPETPSGPPSIEALRPRLDALSALLLQAIAQPDIDTDPEQP